MQHTHIYCTYQRHMSAHFVRRPGASCIYARNPPDVEGGGGGKSSNGVTRATWRGQLAVLLVWGGGCFGFKPCSHFVSVYRESYKVFFTKNNWSRSRPISAAPAPAKKALGGARLHNTDRDTMYTTSLSLQNVLYCTACIHCSKNT